MNYSLSTTFCKLRGPFLAFRGEPQGFGFPAGRTPNDDQPSCLERPQTATDIAFVTRQDPDQLVVTARHPRTLLIRGHPVEDTFVLP
jgi:hypothetical protein